MASHTREDRIVKTTPCDECGAALGEPCRLSKKSLDAGLGNRLAVHGLRRRAWQLQRKIEAINKENP